MNHVPILASLQLEGLGFPEGSAVENLPAVQESQETRVRSLGWDDPMEESMATQSGILGWRRRARWAIVHRVAKSQTQLK